MMPTGSFFSRDSAASQELRCPPHSVISATQVSLVSPFTALGSLVKSSRSLLKYMEINDLVDRSAMQKTERVFIGHGRSPVWRELKDFLQDRLTLPCEEFNREPTAGIATIARLQQMLDRACFAFLIMTAEDEHTDSSLHARENVIHEIGLFQGRLGFHKAIVLLEQGCAEFSNIAGLGSIPFPAGGISTKFEDIRQVLEREGVI
jgi:predicted nucleotide-binding protein